MLLVSDPERSLNASSSSSILRILMSRWVKTSARIGTFFLSKEVLNWSSQQKAKSGLKLSIY
jgi:hypothetical protein